MLDASVYGIGRGPGNCCLELLLSFLQNPKFHLRPLLELIQHHYLPLRQQIEWGYIIPYLLTGMRNEHPRIAIAFRDSEDRDNFTKFYDMLTTPEPENQISDS
jgi:4-hydroxy 2-oxovalerate aldolase